MFGRVVYWWREDVGINVKAALAILSLALLGGFGFLFSWVADDATEAAAPEGTPEAVFTVFTVKGTQHSETRPVRTVRRVVRQGVTSIVTDVSLSTVTLPGRTRVLTQLDVRTVPQVRTEVIERNGVTSTVVRTDRRTITDERVVTAAPRTVTDSRTVTDQVTRENTVTRVDTVTRTATVTVTDTRTVTDVRTETLPPVTVTEVVTVTVPKTP